MNEEEKLYIESYICKMILLCAEANYKIDRFGNILFTDKNKVIEKMNQIILNSTNEIAASADEIRYYLIKIFKEKSLNPEFYKEGMEVISLLETSKEKEDNKLSVQNDKEIIRN